VPPAADRLESWKEIATYLGRSVRTARRWEAEEGLPVHRHMHRALGSVYAYRSELDAWRQGLERRREPADRREASEPAAEGSIRSIAVLPFANLSADRDDAFFADGLTDEVISDLSRLRSLRVVSRTSSMAFKDTSTGVKTIARELGVQYLVEGAVRRAGRRLRITARLLDAAADRQLWTGRYDGAAEDLFEYQERLAREVVEAFRLRLTAAEDRRLAERPILDLRAYECYLQARQEAYRWRRDAIDRAVALLRQALAIACDNAVLHAALGRAFLQYREAGIDLTPGPLLEAEACAGKAMALDPRSGPVRQLRGWIAYSRGRVQEAVRDLKEALADDPNNPDTLLLLGNCYLISGKVAAARPLIEHLLAVDPLTPLTRCMPGYADVMEGRFEPAVAPYRQMFEMDPGNPMAALFYVWTLIVAGRSEAASAVAATLPGSVQETVPGRLALFLTRAAAGEGAATGALADVEAAAEANDLFPRFLAQGHALAGRPDRALDWLAIAVDRGFVNYPFLAHHDPLLAPLRGDPRFTRLLETVRQRWLSFEP
jgi:non-specific serine/threonine protein kinase